MKGLSVIIAVFILVFGTVASRGANVDKISAETGIPVATLQAERSSTGLGWGGLEKAHLLANATGQSFDSIVAQHQAGQGWGKIAHDNGLKLGRLVSNAHRSSKAALHAKNTQTVHGKSGSIHGKSAKKMSSGHTSKMTSTRGVGHARALNPGSADLMECILWATWVTVVAAGKGENTFELKAKAGQASLRYSEDRALRAFEGKVFS